MERKSGFVAIAGRPNAGKSTLLNRVLGAELSIVTHKAQTTREKVLGILSEERGQIVFVDTPGIHRAREGGLNQFMVDEARQGLEGVSAVWYLVDPRSGLEHEGVVLDLLKESKAPVFILMNKSDLKTESTLAGTIEAAARERGIPVLGVKHISSGKGQGVQELLEETWKLMPEGPFHYPDVEQLSDRPTRFFVAEKVREQLLKQLSEELPYSCAVEIERFDEKVTPPRIEAVIHVERDSQKGIVIGKGGQMIKSIGQAARKDVEKFLGHSVFLGLKVKVTPDWTRDPQAMERLGYVFARKKSRGES